MEENKQSSKNRLLDMFDAKVQEQLKPHLERVELAYRQPLYESDEPIEWVYFLNEGVASLVNTMENGSASEVGTIGNEGMVGLPILFDDKLAPTSAYIQVPGSGLRLKSAKMRELLAQHASLRSITLHYAHAFFNQVAQSAACSHYHNVEQRCCRWLLMTHDRVHTDHFILTQEFLGMMLGSRRSSVSAVAGKLRRRKLIKYVRGHVTVLDRAALEKCSCECYEVSKYEFDRLLGLPLG